MLLWTGKWIEGCPRAKQLSAPEQGISAIGWLPVVALLVTSAKTAFGRELRHRRDNTGARQWVSVPRWYIMAFFT